MQKLCYAAGVWTTWEHGCLLAPQRFTRLNDRLLQFADTAIVVCPLADRKIREKTEPCDKQLAGQNVEVRPLPMEGGRLWRYFRHFRIFWKAARNADAACLDMPQEHTLLAGLVCGLRGIPYFVRLLGDWPEAILASGPPSRGRRFKAYVAEWETRLLVRNASLVLAQGKALSARYSRFNPSAVKADLVHTTLSSDAFYQRTSGSFHDPIRVISVAGLVPLKGLDYLAHAISTVCSRSKRVEWWCVGKGPDRSTLEKLSRRLGIVSQVRFHGYVPLGPELFRLYRKADVFVLPSKSEGVPLAMLEAMANSLPVIVSSVGGIPSIIADGVDGVLVQHGNPEEIADAICRLADDPGLADRIRKAAFEKARKFSADRVWDIQRQLIEATFGTFEHASDESRGGVDRTDEHACTLSHSHL